MKKILFALLLCQASLSGQTSQLVVPSELASQPGNYPDDIFIGGEIQQLFLSSFLTGDWSTPVEITAVAFRRPSQVNEAFNTVEKSLEVRMSTSTRTPGNLST